MVKFLSGSAYNGSKVPVCFYWRTDLTTDIAKDVSPIQSRRTSGQCIANAYFKREDITCFNDGNCNGEGKCLPCTKYDHSGMKLGISHSPPLDIAREFDRGVTDEEIRNPTRRDTSAAIRRVSQDQLPYHIIIRNAQAEIAKCCHWSEGDGRPDQFFLSTIRDGPVSREITDVNGNLAHIQGIVVTNTSFPDEVGTFFPVGTVVVAGFEGRPSFYLEPRTGLIKNGEGVIFPEGSTGTVLSESKADAKQALPEIISAGDATQFCRDAAIAETVRVTDFFNNVSATNNEESIATAQAKLDTANANFEIADEAANTAIALIPQAIDDVNDILGSATREEVEATTQQLAISLDELALACAQAASAVGGTTQADIATFTTKLLRNRARSLRFSGFGAFSKCDFFFEDGNAAAQWNAPEDGSIPCNGIRSDCHFYTGPVWEFATNDKMEIGQPITVEQLQEVRFYSDDWTRFSDPEEEFERRFAFSAPFLWAFKGYIGVPFTPDTQDLILYRPTLLHGADRSTFQTIQIEKVSVSDFTDFEVSRSRSRIQPGSHTLDTTSPPEYPSIVKSLQVSRVNRLSIKHPRKEDEPFIYRTWDPDNNTLVLFGSATPEATIYVVNDTALQDRSLYNTFYDTTNLTNNLPTSLPGAPDFIGVEASVLVDTFDLLEEEQTVSTSKSPLGFHKTGSDRQGRWSSINKVDLVHNKINQLYVFSIIGESVLVDSIKIDYRFLHSVIKQTSFEGKDFSMSDSSGESQLGAVAALSENQGKVNASPQQIAGVSREQLGFNQGYFAWRNKDRNLQLGTINTASDLRGGTQIADQAFTFVVSEADSSSFIVNVTYQVVRYRKVIEITDWYLINECSEIMLKVDDLNVHRVLPLPDASGADKPLTDVLVNNGATGSEVAQWAFENITLTIDGEKKSLVQVYRNTDGKGLPANYVVVGPDNSAENSFGRPTTDNAIITATITFLRAQTASEEFAVESEAELSDEVVELNYHQENLRGFGQKVEFSDSGDLVAGGDAEDAITIEQQEYVWVFEDEEGRPIGRKYSRLMLMYFNIAALNVELFYQWTGTCTTYVLTPDVFLDVGSLSGQLESSLGGTTDPEHPDLVTGARVANALGTRDCVTTPNCGDHEFSRFGGLRKEFEVIVFNEEFPAGKAFYPNAAQVVPPGNSLLVEKPGTLFLKRRGAMWYPYTTCERPRYDFRTNGPLGTDSTELINIEIESPGINDQFIVGNSQNPQGNSGSYGGLKPPHDEAYRGPDRVTPLILDVHPSLRACTSAYSYGNKILTGGESLFTGYARVRGEVDLFWYEGLQWQPPLFGNFGRNRLVFEVSEKRGDYLGGQGGKQVIFRWMPMFPVREDLGSTTELFGEDIEPQHYRLVSNLTPVGGLTETVSSSPERFSHKELIVNKTAASIEYPFSPYFPMFLPDNSLGEEEGNSVLEGDQTGTISTMWAWREQETLIKRAQDNSSVIKGIQLLSPDYALDHRRLEVRLRPAEGDYTLKFTSGTYNLDGSVDTLSKISLGDGPPREMTIDFANKEFSITSDGVYDTSRQIGGEEDDISCTEETATQTTQLANLCSCTQDETDESLSAEQPTKLPARFQHLEELVPEVGFFALYDSEEINTPFAVDIPRENDTDPCCFCIYYTTGIFFKMNLEFLPTENIDPSFDSRAGDFQYTWSRVPHGYPGFGERPGLDNVFNGLENRAENYLQFDTGQILIQRAGDSPVQEITPESSQISAFFPGNTLAVLSDSLDIPIRVSALSPGDPKLHGGLPANLGGESGVSQGQDEPITLDLLFNTYVSIAKVTIGFVAGVDKDFRDVSGLDISYQVPLVELKVIDAPNRTGNFPSTRTGRVIGSTTRTAAGLSIPDLFGRNASDLANEGHLLFREQIVPSYVDTPFWDKYGQEFHLTFGGRESINSMGIAYIQLEVETMDNRGESTDESIFITERKYYTSTGAPPGGNNPEQFLSAVDNASGYWRTSESVPINGANRFRAYAWGEKITDDQPTTEGQLEDLELLQKEKWDDARQLLQSPYVFSYDSFIPTDERNFLEFLGESIPNWQNTLSMTISEIDEVGGVESPKFGVIPERIRWNPPGHTWTVDFEESYSPCRDEGPTEQIINFNFKHLHDNLTTVETARFWDALPTGFTNVAMSTMIAADITFQGGAGGGSSGDIVLLRADLFTSEITTEILENAGFAIDAETGDTVIVANRGE